MTKARKICAVLVAKFIDGYRVIYHMNGEWLLDCPELSLTTARINAERCIDVMKSRAKCIDGSARIYEVNVAADLCDTMRTGLRDQKSSWQQYMHHAVQVLNAREHVSMASFITDRGNSKFTAADDPFLFIVCDNLTTGQHYIDTIRLREETSGLDGMGVVYEVKQGKPCLHASRQTTKNNILRLLTARKEARNVTEVMIDQLQQLQ